MFLFFPFSVQMWNDFQVKQKKARHKTLCVYYAITCTGSRLNSMPMNLQMQEICLEEHRINLTVVTKGKELGNWGMGMRRNYFTMYLLNHGDVLSIQNF